MRFVRTEFNILDTSSVTLIGRFGADGHVASIVCSPSTVAHFLGAGAGGSASS